MKYLKLAHTKLTLSCFCLLTITACSQDTSDLQTFIAQTKSAAVGRITPIPRFEAYESFTYSASDLPSPFVPSIDVDQEDMVANLNRPESTRPREPLEAFPLDSLRMVGTLQQKQQNWGLIKDPQGMVHRVQLGNYIGQSDGKINKITETEIYLVEQIFDGINKPIKQDASISIGEK